MNTTPDCLHCGACCFSDADRFVRVTGDDWSRLGPSAESLAHFIGNRAFMRMSGGHCAALEVRPATGEFFCSIYERRPQVCRDLGRGSPQCEAERMLKSALPSAALAAKTFPGSSPQEIESLAVASFRDGIGDKRLRENSHGLAD